MRKKDRKKKSKEKDNFSLIKDVVDNNILSLKDIEIMSSIDYPLFSFKYLQDVSVSDCNDPSFFKEFLFRMKKLSELGWNEIRKSDRHSFGTEKIPYRMIKPKGSIPNFITPEVEFTVFRATGSNLPFIGYCESKVFHVIFVETKFGDIYNH